MASSHGHNGENEHSDFSDKLKHPFHELKEKLKDTHLHEELHDAKVSLIHKKYVWHLIISDSLTMNAPKS